MQNEDWKMKQKIHEFMRSNRWLKVVPNTLTVCNSLCGFSAILIALYAYKSPTMFTWNGREYESLAVAGVIILCAMIFDALDGFAARLFNAASIYGVQMDSLADMVTFAMAPAVLTAITAHIYMPNYTLEMKSYQYLFIWACCGLYVACGSLRLATYNVHAMQMKKSGDKFSGLPSPGAAAVICSLLFFYSYSESIGCRWGSRLAVHALPYYAAGLGLLMVSTFQYTHAMKWLLSVRRNRRRLIMLIVMIVSLLIFHIWAFMILINLYLLSAPVATLYKRFKHSLPDEGNVHTQSKNIPQRDIAVNDLFDGVS